MTQRNGRETDWVTQTRPDAASLSHCHCLLRHHSCVEPPGGVTSALAYNPSSCNRPITAHAAYDSIENPESVSQHRRDVCLVSVKVWYPPTFSLRSSTWPRQPPGSVCSCRSNFPYDQSASFQTLFLHPAYTAATRWCDVNKRIFSINSKSGCPHLIDWLMSDIGPILARKKLNIGFYLKSSL